MLPPNIVVVIPSVGSGGTERVVVNLLNTWVEEAKQVTLIVYSVPQKPFYDIDSRVEIRYLYSEDPGIFTRFVGYTIGYVRQLRKVIMEKNPSLVLGFLPQINIAVILATWSMRSVPAIVAERNLISHRKIPMFWRFLRFCLYRRAALVTINSELNRDLLERFVPTDRIRFLPNPVRFPSTDSSISKQKIILGIGRLTYQKGFDLLIKAFKKSKIVDQGWRIQIFGEGPECQSLIRLAEAEGVSEFVSFMPPSLDLREAWSYASIFAMPSRYEGMPNALVEAMSCGLVPVVCRGVGDLAYQIEEIDPCLVVPVNVVHQYANALRYAVGVVDSAESVKMRLREIAGHFEHRSAIEKWSQCLSKYAK